MRLSTERDRDETAAIAVLQAALDGGVALLDTADAYGWSDEDRGHNERLIARALSAWPGDRSTIIVATKGGMTRPGGRWVVDGRAKYLARAAENSCRALGVQRIDLYQLHAPDLGVPLSTSVRALADLKRQGLVVRIGLCNVTVSQIEEARRGRLLDVEELAAHRRRDPAALPPMIQFRYQRELEAPDVSEGFSRVDVMPFERRIDTSRVNRAVIIWCDGILVRSRSKQRSPTDVEDLVVDVSRARTLRRYAEEGFRLLGLSWQPDIAEGKRTRVDVETLFGKMAAALRLSIEVEYCSHGAGPPRCWCRKPLPGLGVLLIHRHHLDPASCLYVGEGPQDAGYAQRLGFRYRPATEFFADEEE